MRAVVPRLGKQTRCASYQTCWYSLGPFVSIADEDPSRSDRAHVKYRESFYLRTLYRRKFFAAMAAGRRLLIRRRESLNFVLIEPCSPSLEHECADTCFPQVRSLIRSSGPDRFARAYKARPRSACAFGLSKIRLSRRVKCCRDTSRSACRATLYLCIPVHSDFTSTRTSGWNDAIRVRVAKYYKYALSSLI